MHVYSTRFAGIHGVQNHRASILQSSPVQSILGPPDCSFRPSCAGPAVSNLAWSRMPTYCLCKPSKCLDRCSTRYEGSILCSDYLFVFVLSFATVSELSTSRKDSCAVVLLQHDSWTVRLSPQTFGDWQTAVFNDKGVKLGRAVPLLSRVDNYPRVCSSLLDLIPPSSTIKHHCHLLSKSQSFTNMDHYSQTAARPYAAHSNPVPSQPEQQLPSIRDVSWP